ncbi:Alpha/Beta hydrolase protein [Crucibulum laeve]|uniref:Alpha/Beta hydrolase protein n=1 Tax=Crucibulum laeve TaxID=68775 RepID=A0A5C3M0G0_9AGAR|nr:Alpha/Beta hydrolase protein [Crucibulum laeve]
MPSNHAAVQLPLWYHQPFKAIYISTRLLSLIALLPFWTVLYTVTSRPRSSWSLRESVMVRLLRQLITLVADTGISPLSTDKTHEVPQHELKESSFIWISPADSDAVRGPAVDELVKPVRIPGYVWPKGRTLDEDNSGGFVMLFIHGGGYMMGSGHESFPELHIVREMYRLCNIESILSLDYRLTHEACHPGQLLDALAAYSHLINVANIEPSRIIVVGACAGGHLALMLLRYLHDEKSLPLPRALMIFSPMVDMTIDEELRNDVTKERPNSAIDALITSYIANSRFLGHHPKTLLASPLLSANLAPPGSYRGYPKTFISVGGCEIFERECANLAEMMLSDGVSVTLDVQQDAVHDFWGFGVIVPSNLARLKLSEAVREWVKDL